MRGRIITIVCGAAAAIGIGAVAVFAATSSTVVKGGDSLTVKCDGTKLSSSRVDTKTVKLTCAASATPATATSTTTTTATSTTTATATATSTPPSSSVANVGGCQVFPANNPWNQDVSALPVHPNSAKYIANMTSRSNKFLHADFGGGGVYGIPYNVVPATQAMVPITFTAYGNESDPGPYPVPAGAKVEGGSDRHVLVVRQGECTLYELYNARPDGSGGWLADSGAVFNLASNALRPDYWTSADAAGLPVLAGLVRYDEVAAGAVLHALRFTVQSTQRGFIHPATHYASSSTDANLPPMGLHVRLKASFDTSGYTGQSRVILEGLKKYGMIVADNGGDWYVTGASDTRWNDTDLDQLKRVPGSAFEAVDTGPIIK